MTRYPIALLALTAAGPALAQPPGLMREPPRERLRDRLAPAPTETLADATAVLADLSKIPAKGIPPALLADARGVAVVPRVVKAGFVVAGQGGHGLVIARAADGTWGDPVFVNLGGGGVGFQAGVEATDVVLVFRDRKSLDRLFDGRGKLTLGADAGVAAGPVGRRAQAATDAKLEAEIVSYSRSRGLFAGVALDGAVVRPDARSNALFKADTRPEVAKQVEGLKAVLDLMSREAPATAPPATVPAAMPGRP
ncbi:MAG: lipid-binding SYLF domain-containing protein [Gemmataceae bacterium]|nr:lipid-binding SYLF domain-containing protein [Gemmataceae bacterium]